MKCFCNKKKVKYKMFIPKEFKSVVVCVFLIIIAMLICIIGLSASVLQVSVIFIVFLLFVLIILSYCMWVCIKIVNG